MKGSVVKRSVKKSSGLAFVRSQGRVWASFSGLVEAARPGMWLKPLFLMLVASTYALRDLPDLGRLLMGFGIVGPLLWGGLYMLNAVTDIEDDRKHPIKGLRPFASGRVNPSLGTVVALLMNCAAIFLSLGINPSFTFCVVLMWAKQIAYTLPPLRMKRLFLWDVLTGSIGNSTLRFSAGWFLFSDSDRLPLLLLLFSECLQLAGFFVNRLFTNYSSDIESQLRYNSTSARLNSAAIKRVIIACWVVGIVTLAFLGFNSRLGIYPDILGVLPLESLIVLVLLLAALPFFARAMTQAQHFSYRQSQLYYDLPLLYILVLSVILSFIIKFR